MFSCFDLKYHGKEEELNLVISSRWAWTQRGMIGLESDSQVGEKVGVGIEDKREMVSGFSTGF